MTWSYKNKDHTWVENQKSLYGHTLFRMPALFCQFRSESFAFHHLMWIGWNSLKPSHVNFYTVTNLPHHLPSVRAVHSPCPQRTISILFLRETPRLESQHSELSSLISLLNGLANGLTFFLQASSLWIDSVYPWLLFIRKPTLATVQTSPLLQAAPLSNSLTHGAYWLVHCSLTEELPGIQCSNFH